MVKMSPNSSFFRRRSVSNRGIMLEQVEHRH
jgi:hypothetical protein